MVENQKVPNKSVLDFVMGFKVFGFVSDFDIRISDFVPWRLGAINFNASKPNTPVLQHPIPLRARVRSIE
jgi:hypothetical protein